MQISLAEISISIALSSSQTDVSTGKTVLYTELLFQMQQVASWLRKNGFRTEDTVLIVASNHVELAVMLFGVWRAGGSVACLTLNLLPSNVLYLYIFPVIIIIIEITFGDHWNL